MIKFENDIYLSIEELIEITKYSKSWLHTILSRAEFGYYRKVFGATKGKKCRIQRFKYCKGLFELLTKFRNKIYY